MDQGLTTLDQQEVPLLIILTSVGISENLLILSMSDIF
jgi:hypothetical protein